MRRNRINREVLGALNSIQQFEEYYAAAKFQLAGLRVPGIPAIGEKVAIEHIDCPDVAIKWFLTESLHLAQRLVSAVTGHNVSFKVPGLAISNLNTLWTRLLLSCGAGTSKFWVSLMKPGLESLAVAAQQSCLLHQDIVCSEKSDFLLFPEMVNRSSTLVVASFPHFPSGTIMHHDAWWELCMQCEERGVRLVNYNRSAGQQKSDSHLHVVASEFDNLSWMEIFDPCDMFGKNYGWMLAAAVGSEDFVADFEATEPVGQGAMFVPMCAGVLAAFEEGKMEIASVLQRHQSALVELCQILIVRGFKLLARPRAGYHSLWQVPKSLNGEVIDGDAKKFNEIMLRHYSVWGRPFGNTIAYSPLDVPTNDCWPSELLEILEGIDIRY